MINHIIVAGNYSEAAGYAKWAGISTNEFIHPHKPGDLYGRRKDRSAQGLPDLELHLVGKYYLEKEFPTTLDLMSIGFTKEDIRRALKPYHIHSVIK